jgi:hypothetical protein
VSQMIRQYPRTEMFFASTLAETTRQRSGSSTLQDLVDILSSQANGKEEAQGTCWLPLQRDSQGILLAV